MQFTSLPPSNKHAGSQKWREAVKAAQGRPKEWLMVGNYSPGVASQIRAGMYAAFFPAGLHEVEKRAYMRAYWEVTTRVNGARRCDVYIRWLGETQ